MQNLTWAKRYKDTVFYDANKIELEWNDSLGNINYQNDHKIHLNRQRALGNF